MSSNQKNVLNDKLELCSLNPVTGWYRDGCCNTDENDKGAHTVCAKVNSDFLNGLTVTDAKEKIISKIEKTNLGKRKTLYRLKDWGISRQRYWGCPIPMAYDIDGNVVAIPKENLPVKLPENVNLNSKGNPLDSENDWKNVIINGKKYTKNL